MRPSWVRHGPAKKLLFYGLEEVATDDEARAEVSALLTKRGVEHTSRYHFCVKLKKLWRVAPSEKVQEQEARAHELGKPTKLFHGTSGANALSIIKDGFRLPKHAGMFGRGVYFADCPLKSATFAPDAEHLSLKRLLQDGVTGWVKGKKQKGQLLLCDVYLGNSKTLRRSASKLDPANDLKPSWPLQQLRDLGVPGINDYNSVYVPGGKWLCAVNVSEYVVYEAYQGLPRFLLEFEYEYK